MLGPGRIRGVCAIALSLALAFPPPAGGQDTPSPAPPVELSLPQARLLAQTAVRKGQPVLAYRLAGGLLEADPKSSFAHFVMAHAQGQLGQKKAARKSAAQAYRFADSRLHRFEAAELAARLSYADKSPTAAQFWLRRAVQNAPDASIEAQLGRDFRRVRAENPLSFSIRGAVRPSNNVNNGADSGVQVIDGLPFTGALSGSAQALGGVIGTLDATLGYRLQGDARSSTQIGGRLYISRVALDSDAQALAPTARNGDFASTYGELFINHGFAVGETDGSANIGAAVGQLWSGGTSYYSFVRIDAGRRWRLGERTALRISGSAEQRFSAVPTLADSTALSLTTALTHGLANGDRTALSLDLRHTDSDTANLRTTSASLRATYAFGQQIGPAKLSAGLVVSYADYPDFSAVFVVPGGRQDKSAYADLTLFFPDMDYAGFAPSMHLRAGRKFSNVSRYDTREVSVSLGIESKF